MKITRMLVAGSIAIAVIWLFVDTIPPDALTRTRLTVTANRVREYYQANGHFPVKLSELPNLPPNRDSELIDAWGRPIQYRFSESTFTLLSLGKDGREGGAGEDTDIEWNSKLGE